MRALFIATCLLLAAAPAARAQDELQRAVDALPTQQVYVSPGLLAPGTADALRAEAQREAPGRVFVAVLDVPRSAAQVAAELRDRVGKPGAYGVVANGQFRATGSQAAVDAADAAFQAHHREGPAAVLQDFIHRAASDGGGGGSGGGGGGGALVLLGAVALGGGALLLARRRRRRQEDEEFAEVKDRARDEVVALGEDISALDLDVRRPDLPDATRADYETAVNAYDRADTAWERARSPQDLAPVGAALEEGRWAMESTRARLEGREPPERRPPCFFDPRHGPSSRDVDWVPPTQPDGGAPRPVPACEADAQRVERGLMPETREVVLGGRAMPYYAAGPMYSPFMGGFFGGGLLPGLLIGSMFDWDMGAGWGDGGFDGGGGDFGGGDFGGGDFGGGDF